MEEKKKDTFLIFIYGTIKKDGCRNSSIADQKFLREVVTKPEYALLDLGSFPGIVRVEKDGKAIKGELWEVHNSRKELLDRIEGAPILYRLEEINIEGEDEKIQTYFYNIKRERTSAPFYEGDSWDNSRSRYR